MAKNYRTSYNNTLLMSMRHSWTPLDIIFEIHVHLTHAISYNLIDFFFFDYTELNGLRTDQSRGTFPDSATDGPHATSQNPKSAQSSTQRCSSTMRQWLRVPRQWPVNLLGDYLRGYGITTSCIYILKPPYSFGELNNFFLDLQKVQEIIRKHHQTFLQLF